MKRFCMICALFSLLCTMGFSEGDSAADAVTEVSSEDSVLNLNFWCMSQDFSILQNIKTLRANRFPIKKRTHCWILLPKTLKS